MVELIGKSQQVLVLEDDPHVLSFMESSLTLSGFRVVAARSVSEAMENIEKIGLDAFWAVLSDYRLPDRSGLEFLKEVLELDSSIATLLVTGQGEKAIVQESLSLGVFEYLEKPVTHQELKRMVGEAVNQTHRSRQSVQDRRGLEDLGKLDQRMSGIIPNELSENMQVFYQPLHEVGGDFLITHRYSSSEWVILMGDVSGHDIKSGFVSTYFQGMFRGCVENGSRVQEAIQLFNRVLRTQGITGSADRDLISLSLSAFYLNLSDDKIHHWNFGATPCSLVDGKGFIRECPFGLPPLGWLEKVDLSGTRIPVESTDCLYVFTDGVIEYAAELDVNFFSLIFWLMESRNSIYDLRNPPKDDILAIKYSLKSNLPLSTQFNPILSEHYAGTEVGHIDHLQSNWRRSLMFTLDDRLGDRLYDLLICIREGMLNALIHGCEKSPDKFAHLQISLREDQKVMRIVIDDPGRGHEFDLKKRLEEISTEAGKHLGLGIIQHLSDDFRVDNKGTSLIFDFEITHKPS